MEIKRKQSQVYNEDERDIKHTLNSCHGERQDKMAATSRTTGYSPTVCLHHWHNALPTDNITIQDGNRIRMSPHPTTDNITPTAYRVKPAIDHSL